MTEQVEGAKLVKGVWFPENEAHLTEMIEGHSKIGDVTLSDGRVVGTYQLHKLNRAMKHLPEDRRRVAIDVGAHIGLWAMHLTEMFHYVECFEPVPLHRDLFVENVRPGKWGLISDPNGMEAAHDNGRVVNLWQTGLGAEDGSITLDWNPKDTGNTHAVAGKIKFQGIEVEIRTLDSYGFEDVDFIKIDVEGFEMEVVKGARDTIIRNRPLIVVEQKGNDAKWYGHERNEALSELKRLGMKELDCLAGDYILGW